MLHTLRGRNLCAPATLRSFSRRPRISRRRLPSSPDFLLLSPGGPNALRPPRRTPSLPSDNTLRILLPGRWHTPSGPGLWA